MNKIILFFSFLFLLSCSDNPDEEKKSDKSKVETTAKKVTTEFYELDSIQSAKTLRVILTNTDISYFIYKGQPMGFQYELIERFAKSLDLDVEVVLANSIDHSIELLLQGKGDIIATGMTANAERKELIQFSNRIYSTHQCLIQRKPNGYKRRSKHSNEKDMLRDVLDLENDTVYVKNGSAYKHRMENLNKEIGGGMVIIESSDSLLAMDLMEQVSIGKIKYTVADDNLALLGEMYYPNVDNQTAVSFSQSIAWGLNKNANQLLQAVNLWINETRASGLKNILYNKYFRDTRSVEKRIESPYNFIKEGALSPYDDLIKKYAADINWDWRLLAAQIFKESNFNPKARSWVGAQGLMQLMPRTGASYGIKHPTDPEQGIYGGTRHILWLTELFNNRILDYTERNKFIIGSYNVGQGHVFDAQRLAEKYGKNPQKWEDVAYFLLKKSSPKYYNDPVVKYGYCRGIEVVTYVERIYEVYDLYKGLFEEV